jgi:hypothetical protein
MTKIDIDRLRLEIQNMNRWNVLYKALKQELGALGYWKELPRGNPSKAGKISWAKRKNKVIV